MSAAESPVREPFRRYAEFWPFYLREHANPRTRALHYAGSGVAVASVIAGFFISPWLFVGAAVGGYGFAWVSHFFVEHNRPATFTYPAWSLVSDFRMAALWISGRLGPHLKRADVG